jgi:predicted transcriptional regulator
MEVHLSAEHEAELSRIPDRYGRSADELAREALEHFIVEEARFCTGVQAGIDAANRGDFVPTDEVWATVERALKA